MSETKFHTLHANTKELEELLTAVKSKKLTNFYITLECDNPYAYHETYRLGRFKGNFDVGGSTVELLNEVSQMRLDLLEKFEKIGLEIREVLKEARSNG